MFGTLININNKAFLFSSFNSVCVCVCVCVMVTYINSASVYANFLLDFRTVLIVR